MKEVKHVCVYVNLNNLHNYIFAQMNRFQKSFTNVYFLCCSHFFVLTIWFYVAKVQHIKVYIFFMHGYSYLNKIPYIYIYVQSGNQMAL